MALESASNLKRLSLEIRLRNDSMRIEPIPTPNLGQVDCLGLRFTYVPDGFYLPWSAKDVQWILSCAPLATHLLLDLPTQLSVADTSCQVPFPLPYVVSLQATGWIEWLLGPDANFPNLRYLEVSGDPSSDNIKFLDHHKGRLESLGLVEVSHGWATLIPQFQSLRYLGLSYLYNFPWLSVQLPNLLHFEFIWLGEREKNDFPDIVQFLHNNSSIKMVTYHAKSELPFIESHSETVDTTYIWQPREFHQDWRVVKSEQKRLLYAQPYRSWEDAGAHISIPRPMTKPLDLDFKCAPVN
ncbi:hypothetical protein RhiLY_12231 [Ceratobasidium sp. AG-Ba]|nr:hypothetical protein RhiLY_12231 [Ceratobasidium sp. AG-Ba]